MSGKINIQIQCFPCAVATLVENGAHAFFMLTQMHSVNEA